MNVKEASIDINEKGYVGVAELEADYVFLQPEGLDLSKVFIFQAKHVQNTHKTPKANLKVGKPIATWENVNNTKNRLLSKISKSMNLSDTYKLYPKKNLLIYTSALNSQMNIKDHLANIINENLERDFYNGYRTNIDTITFLDSDISKILIDLEFIYKYITFESPVNNKKFSVFFQPSNYLDSERDLWKLISIIGEDHFKEELIVNHSIINETFIVNSFKTSGQYFYINKEKRKVFSSSNQRVETKYGKLNKIQLASLLKYLNVSNIEILLEKGEINY